ncbi:MAG: BBP7 family outer membrane beta-barrel protein [Gemmataceae bacterium]|nr:BBP7 family outer membrane beta-barrel protein [Gemmataceae bacterium]
MRNGFLGAIGTLVAGATLAWGQPMPYGQPAYPYAPMQGGYGPPPAVMASYGGYGPPQAYGPPQGYGQPQGYAQPMMPGYGAYPVRVVPGVQPMANAAPATLPMAAAPSVVAAPAAPSAAPVVSTPEGSCAGGSCAGGSCGAAGTCSTDGCCAEPCVPECKPKPKKDCKCFFIQPEYLYWWVKNSPMPVPLAATVDPNSGLPITLLGPTSFRNDAFSGMRLTAGGWLDADNRFGIEGVGFFLQQRQPQMAIRSDAGGNPLLFVPLSAPPSVPGPNVAVASPGLFTGGITATQATRVWGGEANAVYNLYRCGCFQANILGGFRYLGLEEDLHINVDSTLLGTGQGNGAADRFLTRNNFYGGQIGLRGDYRCGCWSLGLMGKAALGSVHQRIEVTGGSFTTSAAGATTFSPDGIFARQTSGLFPGLPAPTVGVRTRNDFAVVPEGQLEVGYDLGKHTTFTVGYTFLYLNNVVRPGNQLLSTIVAPIPAPLFKTSDFWAQGVSAGLSFSW